MTSEIQRQFEAHERAKQRKHAKLDEEKERRNKLLALNAADEESA